MTNGNEIRGVEQLIEAVSFQENNEEMVKVLRMEGSKQSVCKA